MKGIFIQIFIYSLLSLFISIPIYAADKFTLDSQHTYVLWRIRHLGFSTQAGKWYASGMLILDRNNPENSKVSATIQLATIITGIPELDRHLKGKSFFNIAKFPLATFISNKIELTDTNNAKVFGILTLHGISKPIILKVKFNQMARNPITNKLTVGFSGKTTIKRSDFGMTTYLPALADEVNLNVEAEAIKVNR